MSNVRLLIVDDDPDMRELMSDALSESFEIKSTGEAGQAKVLSEEFRPAIVLLDVNLEEGNGLDLCSELSQNSSGPFILLISGDHSLELRLEAYSKGGSDFLPKPFRIQELRAKVDALSTFYHKQQQLQQSSEFATKTAMSAMAEASQYGAVLRFFNDMYKADCVEQIKNGFFELMSHFALHSSIQFRTEETHSFDGVSQQCSPIELQIYDQLAQGDRLISFSTRLMVNGRFCSFIVKNMPVDDEVSDGRFRDILATLIEGLDAKVLELQRLGLLRQTSRELALSTERLQVVMKEHENFMTGAMNHVISEIHGSFHELDLTEDQETFFRSLAENMLNNMEKSFVHIGDERDVLDCLRLSLSTVLNDQQATE